MAELERAIRGDWHSPSGPLFSVADHEAPHIPALPKAFEHYRYELGAEVYGSMGITIADTARHAAAVMRNFDFFGAPMAAIVCMHRDLGPADALSVGMYLQTLMLALSARGYARAWRSPWPVIQTSSGPS